MGKNSAILDKEQKKELTGWICFFFKGTESLIFIITQLRRKKMKIKEIFSFICKCTSSALALLMLGQTAAAVEPPEVTSPYAILVDAEYGEILYEKNAYDRTYPASVTKVMTALVVVDAIEQGLLTLDTMITATQDSQEGLSIYGSTQGVDPGEIMSVKDLLYCLMLASANETGNILAIAVAGDLESFVGKMNAKAAEIGCLDTNFMNSHGLHDENHYTTAYDLYLIFREAMSYDVFAEIVGTPVYTTAATNHEEERQFYNSNGLLSEWYYRGYSYDKCIGGKTGSTPEAGRCLVAAAESNGEYVIAVVLGAAPVILDDGSTLLPQMSENRALLQHGIDDYDRRIISLGADPVGQVVVTMSDESDTVMVKAQGEIVKTLPVDMDIDLIEADVQLFVDSVEAPVYAGEVMGQVTMSFEGEVYGTLDVVTATDVAHSEILYQKRAAEEFLSEYGTTMVGGVVVAGASIAGAKYAWDKKKRRHSWRNNQRKNHKKRYGSRR